MAIVASVLNALIQVRHGPGVTADSSDYLTCAESLAHRQGFQSPWEPYHRWPPLFPLFIAGLSSLGLDTRVASATLNVVAVGGLAYLVAWHVRQCTQGPWWALTAAIAVCASPAVFERFLFVHSDPIFALLAFFCLCLIHRSIVTSSRLAWWIAVAVAALAALQRYIGVSLLATVTIAGLFRPGSFRRRLSQSLSAALLAATPLALWLTRNARLTGTWTGEREPSVTSFWDNVRLAADTIEGWVLPTYHHRLGAAFAAVAVISLVACLARSGFRSRPVPSAAVSLALHSLWLLGYGSSILLASTWLRHDPIDDRLLLPLLPSFIVLVVIALDAIWQQVRQEDAASRSAFRIVVVCVVLLLSFDAWAVGWIWRDKWLTGPGGFNTVHWRQSAVGRWVEQCQDQPLYSNGFNALWLLTGVEGRRYWPARSTESSRFALLFYGKSAEARQRDLECPLDAETGSFCLVWFYGPVGKTRALRIGYVPENDPYLKDCELVMVDDSDVGRLYRCQRRRSSATDAGLLDRRAAVPDKQDCLDARAPRQSN